MWNVKRRDFLKLTSLAAAGGALPLLRGSRALGAPGDLPKRVVFVYLNDGLLLGDAEPRPAPGAPSPTETGFDLPACLSPLAAFKSDMLLLENLDMVSATTDPTAPANAHLAGETHALTGAYRFSDSLPGAASIDQFLAQELSKNGPVTPLRSLEVFCSADMAYNDGFKGPKKIASTSAPGQHVDALGRPDEIYDRLFGMPSGGAGQSTAALERQTRLYDFLRGQHGALGGQLEQSARDKIDQHMQLLSDIETRRTLMLASQDREVFWPPRSLVVPAENLNWTYNAPRNPTWYDRYELAVPLNMKLVAAALHADLTRVATISLDPPPAEGLGFNDGMFGAVDWHDLIHLTNDDTQQTAQSTDPVVRSMIIALLQNAMDKVRVLAEELATLQEVDGSRMLDHTLVVFTSQIAYGNHWLEHLPWFTLGNIDDYFRTGRLVSFPRTTDPQASWRTNGRPHNDLFVSVANAMGVPITSFGEPGVCTGAIDQLR